MAKTLIEQMNELKAKIKEEEKIVVSDIIDILDEMDVLIDKLKASGNKLMPNENLSIHLSHLFTVLATTKLAFEQEKNAVVGAVPNVGPIITSNT